MYLGNNVEEHKNLVSKYLREPQKGKSSWKVARCRVLLWSVTQEAEMEEHLEPRSQKPALAAQWGPISKNKQQYKKVMEETLQAYAVVQRRCGQIKSWWKKGSPS